MELTLVYMLVLSVVAVARPMLGLFILTLLPQPGVTGALQDAIGLKPWAGQPACIVLGCLALIKALQNRRRDFFWPVVILALSGLYIVGTNAILGNYVRASFNAVFHGGLLAAFFVYQWSNRKLWSVMGWGMATLLVLSAATYWLSDVFPVLSNLSGVLYGGEVVVRTHSAESISDLVERVARGAGVFHNNNCWAQMAALGVVVGVGMVVLSRGVSRLQGAGLVALGLLGIVGSMGRSATVAVIAGTAFLLGGRFVTRSALGRLCLVVGTALVCWGLMSWAGRKAAEDASFRIGSAEGSDYRTRQIWGVLERSGDYWFVGNQEEDRSKVEDDPHDIVLAYLFYFGLLPAVVAILGLLAGVHAAMRWIMVGGEALGRELSFPEGLGWLGHLVVPTFFVICISGIGNGIAAGTPYREVFLMLIYASLKLGRARKCVGAVETAGN